MNTLSIRFWGTRGSIPTPGRRTEKYGGNTTCLELRYGETIVVIDAGSGIRELSSEWDTEFRDQPIHAHLLFTHLHWDHIQGFPFFAPAYAPKNSFVLYGEERPSGGLNELLGRQMTGDYFPVPLAAMKASMTFETARSEFTIGPLQVRTLRLPHPGGCLAYRIETGSNVFVLATDCELDQVALNQDELAANFAASRQFPPDLLEFLRGANLLVIDCQFTDEQYRQRRGWGHNGLTTVAEVCRQATPDMLALFHHDPQSHDEKVTQMVQELNSRLQNNSKTLIFAAREGLTLDVVRPRHPPKLDD